MVRSLRTAVAALAVAGFVAQPVTANAGLVHCIHVSPTAPGDPGGALPMLGAFAFFVCAGFTLGKVDADNARGIKVAQKGDHFRALVSCLLPFHHKHKDVVSAKG
ncbi:MAG TPA: hypothetical protein VHA70_15920 [Bauldia sp.]|nr:hypothetical protein [Bauldia sp.]